MKPDKISIGLHALKSNISKLTIGLNGFNFSKRITSKYGIFRKSDSMPALVFRRLFGIRTANNSLYGGQFNNCVSLQKFYYLINPLRKTLGFFSNSVISTHDIRVCTKIQTSTRCYNPAPVYPDIHQYLYAASAGKTNTGLGHQNWFFQNIGHEKTIHEQIREGKKQFILVLPRNILTSVNPAALSYLQKTFNFGLAGSKPGRIIASAKKSDEIPTNINAATQNLDTPSIKKMGTDSQYENNVTEQTWERKKQLIPVLHQQPIYKKNILTSLNSVMLSYLQKTFNFGSASSKPNQMRSTAKKMKIPSAKKSGISQGTDIPSFRQTRTLKDDENIAPEQIREEKKQFIQELHRASISSKTVLTSANPVTLGYLNRNNIETAGSKIDRKLPVARTEIPSARKSVATQFIETQSLRQTGTLKDDKNIAPEQIWEGEKKFIPVLHQPPLHMKNIPISVNPVTLGYLQRISNFESAGSRPDRIIASSEKPDKSPTNTIAARGADALSYQQIWNIQNLQYENFFNHDTKPGRENLIPAFHNIKMLKRSSNPSYNNVFPAPLINLKRVGHIMKKGKSMEADEDIVYNSRELVLKKPATQKAEIVPENKGGLQNEKSSSSGMHDNLIKESVKEKPMHEISMIADRVYKIIERRISIEKDRRGLF